MSHNRTVRVIACRCRAAALLPRESNDKIVALPRAFCGGALKSPGKSRINPPTASNTGSATSRHANQIYWRRFSLPVDENPTLAPTLNLRPCPFTRQIAARARAP